MVNGPRKIFQATHNANIVFFFHLDLDSSLKVYAFYAVSRVLLFVDISTIAINGIGYRMNMYC